MIRLLFGLLHFYFCIKPGEAEKMVDIQSVDFQWIRSVLEEKFTTTRHHSYYMNNKLEAKEFIVNHFKNLSLDVQYDEFMSYVHGVNGVNIIGVLPGYQSSNDTVYMIGAYYDTKNTTEGILNNGAGVVGMLEAARLLVKSGRKKNTLLFVAFDLHATGNPKEVRCCQGAKHFVSVWLSMFLNERKKKYLRVNFGGAILLESILNYNNGYKTQDVSIFDSYQTGARDFLTSIRKDFYRGNFILLVCTEKDKKLNEPFLKIWDLFPEVMAKIHLLEFSLTFANDFVFQLIEEKSYQTDVFSFYSNDRTGILVTDTAQYRLENENCFYSHCNERKFLSEENILFVGKTVATLVLTLEVLAGGNMSDLIITKKQTIEQNTNKIEDKNTEPLGKAEKMVDIQSVDFQWIRSVLEEKFTTTRHHSYYMNNKLEAVEFIVNHFKNLSLDVQYDDFISYVHGVNGVNIIGILPGYQSSNDTVYMIGAYYDTESTTEGILNNGAGVVGMLEAARLLVKSGRKKNTLLFVAFDLHATGNPKEVRCCQGAKHFVSVWLSKFLNERKKKYPRVNFGGAILLESILKYNNGYKTQDVSIFDLYKTSCRWDYFQRADLYNALGAQRNARGPMRGVRDFLTSIRKDFYRGNFILLVCTEKDKKLNEPFLKIWDFFPEVMAKIHLLEFSLTFANDFVFQLIEEKSYQTDVFSFYSNNRKGILVTDTAQYRLENENCFYSHCNERRFLSEENILFVGKTVATLVLTLEVLAGGNMSDLIITKMQTIEQNTNKIEDKNTEPLEQTCPMQDYLYDELTNMYYKLYRESPMDNWIGAAETCEKDAAQLMILWNRKMIDLAMRATAHDSNLVHIWVGMSDVASEGEWKWVDGTNVTITFWDSCQPDNAGVGEDCGVLNVKTGTITDENCKTNFLFFVCTCTINSTVFEEKDVLQEEDCVVKDYTFLEEANLYYKVFEESVDHGSAVNICADDHVLLLSISTIYEYSNLNKITSELDNNVFHIHSNDRFYHWYHKSDVREPFVDINESLVNVNNRCYVLVVNVSMATVDYRNCSEKFPVICGKYCKSSLSTTWKDYDSRSKYFVERNVIITTDTSIKQYIMKTHTKMLLKKEIRTDEPVYTLDILHNRNVLFWHSRKSTFIMQTNWSDTSSFPHRKFVHTGDPFTDLSVDWMEENIYWSSMTTQTISVSNGKLTKILYLQYVVRPQSLQVEPIQGLLFWLEPAGIMCGTMDGRYKIKMMNGKFDRIAVDKLGLSIFISFGNYITMYRLNPYADELNEIVDKDNIWEKYCVDKRRSSQNIDVIMYQRIDRPEFLLYQPRNLAEERGEIIFRDENSLISMLYLSPMSHVYEFDLQNVYHLNEDWNVVKIIDDREFSKSISSIHSTCQQLTLRSFPRWLSCVCPLDGVFLTAKKSSCDISICSKENGKCSQKCSDMNDYPYVYCSCYKGFHMSVDEKTCINADDIQTFLLLSDQVFLDLYFLQGKLENKHRIPVESFSTQGNGGIEFDPKELQIYWVQGFGIRRTYLNGTGVEEFYSGTSIEICSITLDVFQRRILFSVSRNSTIESIGLDGKNHRKEYKLPSLYYPSFIILDTFNGFIYYHRANKLDFKDTGIYRIDVENKHEEVIIPQIIGPADLRTFAVDKKAGIIYWISGKYKNIIEMHAILGTNGKTVVSESQLIEYLNLCLVDDDLYITGNKGEFGRINLPEGDGQIFSSSSTNRMINLIAKGTFKMKTHKGIQNTSCIGISKCLDASMEWICLSPEQICDEVDHCYDGYDEMHCEYRQHQKKYISIILSCQRNVHNQYLYERQDLVYVKWETHLFSRFINYRQLPKLQCTVDYEIFNLKDSSTQHFKIISFNSYHRFRQIVLRGRNQYLKKLVLSGKGISHIWSDKTFEDFLNLHTLELTDIMQPVLPNKVFINLSQLQTLWMRFKSLKRIEAGAFIGIHKCVNLTITGSQIQELYPQVFNSLTHLVNLDISQNRIGKLETTLFSSMISLQVLDTRGNDIYISGKIFQNNLNLKLIYSDTFALCCVKPQQMTDDHCIAPKFDLSSCEDLIENIVLRIFLWIIGIVAVIGNMMVLIYRIRSQGGLYQDTFSVLVGNLTLADTLIGVYLISIGTSDAVFRGEFIWKEYKWRNSKLCAMLGIISVLSSEVSVLTISLITFARYLAVKFPFKEHKISRKDAVIGSVISWIVSLCIALIPHFIFEKYYSASGVCVSLPLRKERTDGWIYSFLIFVVFNFLTFLFVALAQIPIVYEVKKISSKVSRTGTLKHIEVAKRLSLVVATDCLCWIPIGTMGVMAMFGYDMKRTVYAWTVVFVLPINSAINPFLYTFIDLQVLEKVLNTFKKNSKNISKKLLKVAGLIAFASVFLMVAKIITDIVESEDFFKLQRQFQKESLKKEQEVAQETFQTTLFNQRLMTIKAKMENDYCYKGLKETGIGYCCIDWSDLNKGCFKISMDPKNWYEAEVGCREIGNLATVDDSKRSKYLTSIFDNFGNQSPFWIGLYSYLYKNDFKWIETDSALKFNDISGYLLRKLGNFLPVNGCVKVSVIGHTYFWTDDHCYTRSGSVCEIDFNRSKKYIPASLCPYGWIEIGKSCMLFSKFTRDKSFQNAMHISGLYGHLVTIDKPKLHENILPILRQRARESLVDKNSYWIGLEKKNNTWIWINTQEPADYTNWIEDEPNSEDNCVAYESTISNFRWRGESDCNVLLNHFISEKLIYNWYH